MAVADLDLCTLQEDEIVVMTEIEFTEMIECFPVPTILGNTLRLDDRVTYLEGIRATSKSIGDGPTFGFTLPRVNKERKSLRSWL